VHKHETRLNGGADTTGLQGLPFQKIQHRVDTKDAQPSNDSGGIMVMVTGALMVCCEDTCRREDADELCPVRRPATSDELRPSLPLALGQRELLRAE
jgi:hypothetical protein